MHCVTISAVHRRCWGGWAKHARRAPDAFKTVRLAASGAAKLPARWRSVRERFDLVVNEGYGLTETSPRGHCRRRDRAAAGTEVDRAGRCPASSLRLVDEVGELNVFIRRAGELWVQWRNAETCHGLMEGSTMAERRAALHDQGLPLTAPATCRGVNDDGRDLR